MRFGPTRVLPVLWLLTVATMATAQDFEKGLAAARSGDFATALGEWRPLADAGDAEAQFNVAALYESGLGVPADLHQAASWYALAAGQGHARAQYNLGVMYTDGRGVPRDDTRALTWLGKAAEQGHAKAQYNLGILYQAGRGITKDPEQAQIWLDRAAANGVDPLGAGARNPPGLANTRAIEPLMRKAGDESARAETTPTPETVAPAQPPRSDSAAEKDIGLSLSVDGPRLPGPDSDVAPGAMDGPAAGAPAHSVNVASLAPGQLRIGTNFPAGAQYRIEVVESRQRARDGRFVMAQSSDSTVDMRVGSQTGEDVQIEWTLGAATVKTAGDRQVGRLASELGKLLDGQKVAYRTGADGAVSGLDNPAQLVSFYQASIERVLEKIDAEFADPALVDTVRTNLAPLLSADYAAARALELPKLLHFFAGLELTPGKTYRRASIMTLPPSADALPSTIEYELKWFDRTAGVAWLRWRQSVDPERAAGAVKEYIEMLAKEYGGPTPDRLNIGAVEVSDSADYEIDLATGFPRQVIYTRRVELFGFTQTEKRRIRVRQ